jgi:hypothetical protein
MEKEKLSFLGKFKKFFAQKFVALDKKLEEEAKNRPCCAKSSGGKNKTCCS